MMHYSDRPRIGFYRTRLRKGAPWVGAVICMPCPWIEPDWEIDPSDWCTPLDRSRPLRAYVNGEPADPWTIWWKLHPIPEREYRFLVADRAWASRYAPDSPEAMPSKAVDLDTLSPLF